MGKAVKQVFDEAKAGKLGAVIDAQQENWGADTVGGEKPVVTKQPTLHRKASQSELELKRYQTESKLNGGENSITNNRNKDAHKFSQRMGDRFTSTDITVSLHLKAELPEIDGLLTIFNARATEIRDSKLITEGAKKARYAAYSETAVMQLSTSFQETLQPMADKLNMLDLAMVSTLTNAKTNPDNADLRQFIMANGGISSFIGDAEACLSVLTAPKIIQKALGVDSESKKELLYRNGLGDVYVQHQALGEMVNGLTSEYDQLIGKLSANISNAGSLLDEFKALVREMG